MNRNIVRMKLPPVRGKRNFMQRSINELIGYRVGATDGEIGKVEEFYFDDLSWKIRYLIVKTGNWLSGRSVLISPDAAVSGSWGPGTFPVRLTKEQVRDSPDIDTDKPVSRRQEIELYGHYGWQSYWGSGFFAGGFANISDASPIIDEKIIHESANSDPHNENDPHLRSTQRITGYHIHASDGDIGHVNDFILDDQTWQISYIVVDTHNWIGGKKVLIAPQHIKEVQWENSKVMVDISVDSIQQSAIVDKWDNNKGELHLL